MNIRPFNSGLLVLVILILFACNKDFDLSTEIQGNVKFVKTQYTDSLTLETSVGIWDTVRTTMTPYMLIGKTQDTYFGSLTANAFTQLILPKDSIAFRDKNGDIATLDSAVFSLQLFGSYGNISKPQTIQIHVLNQPIDTNIVYYQYDKLDYGDKLAETTITKQDLGKPIRMKLNSTWAKRFYDAGGKAGLRTQADFESWFPGIRVSITGGDAVHKVNQLSTNTYLKFYYHTSNNKLTTKLSTQNKSTHGYRFNQIDTDLSTSSFLSNLKHEHDISTHTLKNLAFVREGSGIYTKVHIPNLLRLNQLGNIYVNRAELILETSDENFLKPNINQPIGLTFNLLDRNNRLIRNAKSADEQYILREVRDQTLHSGGYADGRLVSSYLGGGRTYQNVRMTSYIQDILNGIRPNYGFAIQAYRNDVDVNSFIFYDHDAEKKNLKLRIYYTIVK